MSGAQQSMLFGFYTVSYSLPVRLIGRRMVSECHHRCWQTKILSCQRKMMLACLPVFKIVSAAALQVLMGKPPLNLEVFRICNAFIIRKGLPLVEELNTEAVNRLNKRERQKPLMGYVCGLCQPRWECSRHGKVTYNFIREFSFVENRHELSFGSYLGFLFTGRGSLHEFWRETRHPVTRACLCGHSSNNL